MFWNKKSKAIVNEIPDDYVFSDEYELVVEYSASYHGNDWRVSCDDILGSLAYGKTKEEAIILGQNALYYFDLEQKKKKDNPPETFVVPPIRKF
jgi:predicted RNase H-like HicB family nuclease